MRSRSRQQPDVGAPAPPWTEARFPNGVMLREFLEQIRLWNRIEDLSRIVAEPAADGITLRYRCADYRREGLRKLVRSYGGTVTLEPPAFVPADPALIAAAFDAA